MTKIDLCWLGSSPPTWEHGDVHRVADLAELARAMTDSHADAVLCWDAALGPPRLVPLGHADVIHGGLALGMRGLPAIIDFVHPTWMWNADADPRIASTSWRLSLRACLVRTEVIRQLGGPHPGFRSLAGAGLELGHRYLTRGALVRHDPALAPAPADPPSLPLYDEVLFARRRFGAFWTRWALGRGIATGTYSVRDVASARAALAVGAPATAAYERAAAALPLRSAKVSAIIPTIERYPYLRQLLEQLAVQTVPAHEIIVVDQTPRELRDANIESWFPDLPIRVIWREQPGQCSARNDAIAAMTGDHALFLDDDVEVGPDLIARHLARDVDVSCGVADEVGAPVPDYQGFLRASDTFPTGNSLVRVAALRRSGLFDVAFDCKPCEDGDLGMRLYLAGVEMILDPGIRVLHHRAPRGGLRVHKARVVTYASSRSRITHRNLPHASEVYLATRYFTPRQVREMLVLRRWSTLQMRGKSTARAAKLVFGLVTLPSTNRRLTRAVDDASRMAPKIPFPP